MSSLSTLPKGDSAWLLRKSIQRVMQQVSVLETNIGSSTTGNSANTQIIFNDNGTLRGDAQFTWNKTLNQLTVDGDETISGDLTVASNVLKVDSTNDRVGIGTATPATILDIQSAGGVFARIQNTTSTADAYLLVKNTTGEGFFGINALGPYIYTASALPIVFTTATSERYRIAGDGVATWSNVGGVAGTAMTLNSSGLGVGVSPTFNIHARGTTDGRIQVEGASGYGMVFIQASSGNSAQLQLNSNGGSGRRFVVNSNSSGQFLIGDETAVATRLTIDSSGNVGVGVTPSYKLDTYTTLGGTVNEKRFANRTSNKILVKRYFSISADTALFSIECGTAGSSNMAAFEINVFATGTKVASSADRQFYGKFYVTRNLAGTFTITSAFSSGSSGAFTVAASGTSLNVNGIFSVISDGSACVEITGYIGGRDTIAESNLTVTMP